MLRPAAESFVDQIDRALDLEPDAALRFVIDPLSLTRIDRLNNGWRVVAVNRRG
jgi:hypothetical protein